MISNDVKIEPPPFPLSGDTHPLHQSMPEEVRQCANIVKDLCVFVL